MDTRVLILTLPSLVVLGLLIVHSFRTLPRARAVAFWCSVAAYGVARGVALRWVIDHGLGASFPYAIRNPLFPVFGVPLQEIAGWAIVTYLGWWLGSRASRHLFHQIAWACLFLGAISWTVESAAVAAGWWSWTVPVTHALFVNVPLIAIVDWFFVGIDFLLPFAVLTAPELRGRPVRFVALLAFPLHFASHAVADRTLGSVPIPFHHLTHWILISILLWLALRSATIDAPFAGEAGERRPSWLPVTGLSVILVVAAAVELLIVHRPRLLLSILPALAVSLQTFRPAAGYALGGVALVLSAWVAPLALAAAPAATAATLAVGRRHRTWVPIAAMGILGLLAYQVHVAGARKQDELMRRLSSALAARDRGDIEAARNDLTALCGDFPGSHVPPALLGEIEYRTERLEEARKLFASAVEIKQDYAKGFRYLTVIDLRLGRTATAARFAERGLVIDREDVELSYLLARARGTADAAARLEIQEPEKAQALASLAFEVGDTAGAASLLDRGLARWPEQRSFYPSRVKLALQDGDGATARRVVTAWRDRFPQDAEARQLSRQLGMD